MPVQLGNPLQMRVMSQETEIAARVEQLLTEPVAGLGIKLLDVQYRQEGRWILRLVITKDNGISLDDCGAVSELAGRILDVEDPIPTEFALEVSSPGLFRSLREEKHFHQSIGMVAKIKLAAEALPDQKIRALRGTITEVTEDGVALKTNGDTTFVPFGAIASAKLDPDL